MSSAEGTLLLSGRQQLGIGAEVAGLEEATAGVALITVCGTSDSVRCDQLWTMLGHQPKPLF